jgi:putative nucleotidyltransferase-like protein
MTALQSTRLILDSLRPDQTPTRWESDRIHAGTDWDDLAVRSIVLGLAPQLHRRFTTWALEIPARATAKFAATYQATAKRNVAIYQQLAEVLTACHQHNLQPIALKGIHLAAAIYPDPALRPMNDIDLLFKPDQLSAAEEVLQSLDYGRKHKSSDLGAGVTKHTSTFKRESDPAATPNPYLSTQSSCMIEPHVSLEESWFGLQVDITPGVRERSIEINLNGQPCHVLALEDLLLHLCVHFCFHLVMGAPSMVQLSDLLIVTEIDQLDWPTFINRAIAARSAPYALAALTLAQKLLGAPVPAETIDQLARCTPDRLRQRVQQLDLIDVLRRTQQKPLTSISQRIQRGFQDRRETARWAQDWRGRWRVWQTMLSVFKTDTGRMILRKG